MDQCKAQYDAGRSLEYGMSKLNCVRKEGHDGPHFDHYGRWEGKQVVPIERANHELGIKV